MKINISDNIRKFRKERSLTQEQLAEALGVTVGAVSKWELGSSVPDINLITELADFFETSVDVLLGYEWRSGSMGTALEKVKTARRDKNYEEGIREAEKALVKYPNCFDIIYHSGTLFEVMGIEQQNENALRRALDLFKRSLELFSQNTDPQISNIHIHIEIADVLEALGKYEEAIEELQKYNINELNNGRIGHILATYCRKTDDALLYLSHALSNNIWDLYRICFAYTNIFIDTEDFESGLELLLWLRNLMSQLKKASCVSSFDKCETTILTACAYLEACLEHPDRVRTYLQDAVKIAQKFDATPDYSMMGIKFYHGDPNRRAFDSLGASAMQSIENVIQQNDEPTPINNMFREIWEEIKNEIR